MCPSGKGSRQRLNAFEEIMMQDAQYPPPPLYIVVMEEVLVARDIEMMIRDLRPDATVIVAQSLGAVEAELPDTNITAAFLQADPPRILVSAVGQRLLRDGGQTILVGHEPGEAAEGALVLPFPFARGDVVALLAGAAK
jgi:hypothetical protein